MVTKLHSNDPEEKERDEREREGDEKKKKKERESRATAGQGRRPRPSAKVVVDGIHDGERDDHPHDEDDAILRVALLDQPHDRIGEAQRVCNV